VVGVVETDALGDPLRCDGCGSMVERILPGMWQPMPAALAAVLYGCEEVSYLVCAPLPDGRQPCLRRALTLDAVTVARSLAPAGGFLSPIVIAGVPRDLMGWWVAAGEPRFVPGSGYILAGCDNPRCGREMWLGPNGQALAGIAQGQAVRLCLPRATVERTARGGCPIVTAD
jgi:hypothetical protein